MMERLFTQDGTWMERIAPADPREKAVEKEHHLSAIRVSISTRTHSETIEGREPGYSARLFWLSGKSLLDGEAFERPTFGIGDAVISPMGDSWAIRAVNAMFSPDGSLHHLEVELA